MAGDGERAGVLRIDQNRLLRQVGRRAGWLSPNRLPSPGQRNDDTSAPAMNGRRRCRDPVRETAPAAARPPGNRTVRGSRPPVWRAASGRRRSDRPAAGSAASRPSQTRASGTTCAAVSAAIWSCRFSTSGMLPPKRRRQVISPELRMLIRRTRTPISPPLRRRLPSSRKSRSSCRQRSVFPGGSPPARDRGGRDAGDAAKPGERLGDFLGQPERKGTFAGRSGGPERHHPNADRVAAGDRRLGSAGARSVAAEPSRADGGPACSGGTNSVSRTSASSRSVSTENVPLFSIAADNPHKIRRPIGFLQKLIGAVGACADRMASSGAPDVTRARRSGSNWRALRARSAPRTPPGSTASVSRTWTVRRKPDSQRPGSIGDRQAAVAGLRQDLGDRGPQVLVRFDDQDGLVVAGRVRARDLRRRFAPASRRRAAGTAKPSFRYRRCCSVRPIRRIDRRSHAPAPAPARCPCRSAWW